MSTLQELQEKRNKLAAQIKETGNSFNEETGQWSDTEIEGNWQQLNDDYDAVVAEMDAATRANAVRDRLQAINDFQSQPANTPQNGNLPGRENAVPGMVGNRAIGNDGEMCTEQHRAQAVLGWMRAQMGEDVDDSMQEAARLSGIRLNAKNLTFASPDTRYLKSMAQAFQRSRPENRTFGKEFFNAPLTTQTAGTGGNTIPAETLLRELEINMLSFSPMSQFADLLTTASGEPLKWPTVDDTGNTGVQVGENANVDGSGSGGPTPTFAQKSWGAYKLTSLAILVPYELIQDNVVDLLSVLGQLMGERIGRLRNQRYTTGTGSNQATGIVTAAAVGVTAAGTTAITSDEIIDLQHSVDPAYRQNAQFMMHDSVVKYVRKLKDNDGQYLWQSGMQAGVPDTLYGSTLVINQDMASSIAASAKTILYGQLSRYKIRRAGGFRMYRLEEKYRDTDQDGFIMFVREDGNLLDAGTNPVKFLQQAAS